MALERAVCVDLTLRNPLAEKALRDRVTKVTRVSDGIKERLRTAIRKGFEEGESVDQVSDRVKRVFNAERSRARTIARTEMNGAASDARMIQVKRTLGTNYRKTWITARDFSVRDSHKIDGQTKDSGEPFSNRLQRPHDPDGRAQDVINCRCILTFATPEELDIV